MAQQAREPARFSIGRVCELTGMSEHALRYYEKEDLLVGPVERTSGGRRQYSQMDVEWLRICVRLRESGMPLADLRAFAALVRQGPGNEPQRLQLLDAHRQRVEAQIEALEECRRIIAWKVDVYSENLQTGTTTGLWEPHSDHGSGVQPKWGVRTEGEG